MSGDEVCLYRITVPEDLQYRYGVTASELEELIRERIFHGEDAALFTVDAVGWRTV
jgi:hypothetical protein